MNLVLGLGNPGQKYIYTRHNIGFLVLDRVQEKLELSAFSEKKNLKSLVTQGGGVVLAKPLTFMNDSGVALDLLRKQYTIEEVDIIEVRDDLDIPFGNIKIHKTASTAGHKGAVSIAEYIDLSQVTQVRLGIAGDTRGEIPGEKYVLSEFSKKEKAALPSILDRSADAILLGLREGFEKAAQQYNQKQRA